MSSVRENNSLVLTRPVARRSLGDAVAHSAGVSSEPEFTTRVLGVSDRFLIVASDGLWEFVSDQV